MTVKRNGTPTRYVFLHNGERLKKAYHNGTKEIWSAGSAVTYVVDTDESYTEEVDYGATCLAPTTFTPSKSDWIFVGWREDTSASSDVLTSKVMESDPITLYAVFKKDVTVTWYDGSGSHDDYIKTRYYNHGNYANPSFTLTQSSMSGWEIRGWGTSTPANASVVYSNGSHEITADVTVYALYEQTVTATFESYNNTATANGTRYYNASGNTDNATITVPTGATYSGWTWRGWSAEGDTVADTTVAFVNNDTISGLSSDGTYYGLYQKVITLTTVVESISTPYNKTAYYNAAGNTKNPTFTVDDPTVANCTFIGWAISSSAQDVTHESITDMVISDDMIFYALLATHYYTSFIDYPLSFVYQSNTCHESTSYVTKSNGYEMETKKNEGELAAAVLQTKVTLPTNRCNKVRIRYEAVLNTGNASINGTLLSEAYWGSPAYITFDCSGDEFEMLLDISTGNDYSSVYLEVGEIYFYYE